tara:strand:+ start:533 stop:1147 length:615 start_codon:yes stop_codon:yes gene_type:complete
MLTLNILGLKVTKPDSFFRRPTCVSGFTLIELMVTIAIIGIVALFGIPAFGDFVLNNRIRGQASDFLVQLKHARLEAMRTATRVTVCPGTEAGGCDGTNWENGWMVFIDVNTNAVLDSGEAVIGIGAALDGDNTLRSSAFANYISFRHDGSSTSIAGSGLAGSFALCDSRGYGDKARAIAVSASGRVKALPANAAGSGISSCDT